MVDEETPEPPPPDLLPLAGGWEGAAEEEDGESEMTTTLVTTCPPGSVVTTAEVNVVVGVDGVVPTLVGVVLVCAGACEVGCCAAEDWVVDVWAGCCCCDVEVAAGGLLEVAACCVDESAGVADEAGAAAGEELAAETVAWRGKKTFRAGGFGSSTRSLRNTRANISRPARTTLIPKKRAARPARMFERQ